MKTELFITRVDMNSWDCDFLTHEQSVSLITILEKFTNLNNFLILKKLPLLKEILIRYFLQIFTRTRLKMLSVLHYVLKKLNFIFGVKLMQTFEVLLFLNFDQEFHMIFNNFVKTRFWYCIWSNSQRIIYLVSKFRPALLIERTNFFSKQLCNFHQ